MASAWLSHCCRYYILHNTRTLRYHWALCFVVNAQLYKHNKYASFAYTAMDARWCARLRIYYNIYYIYERLRCWWSVYIRICHVVLLLVWLLLFVVVFLLFPFDYIEASFRAFCIPPLPRTNSIMQISIMKIYYVYSELILEIFLATMWTHRKVLSHYSCLPVARSLASAVVVCI